MYEVFADLHVHIGRSENNKPIKITAARSLNFANIAKECVERKGINVVGIIDCASPYVIEDIENFLTTGEAYEIEDGGIIYKDKVCILYRESASANPMQHTGIYLGDGYVMDARGSASGVVYSKLSSYGWTHWAIPKGLYDGTTSAKPEEVL